VPSRTLSPASTSSEGMLDSRRISVDRPKGRAPLLREEGLLNGTAKAWCGVADGLRVGPLAGGDADTVLAPVWGRSNDCSCDFFTSVGCDDGTGGGVDEK
jgi:hypothetical protein